MFDWLKTYWTALQILRRGDDRYYPNVQNVAFIGCAPRSGSTMLMRVLDSHSQIASPCELAIPRYFRGDKKEKIVNNKYRQICHYYDVKPLLAKLDPRRLFRRIVEKEGSDCLAVKEPRQSLFFEAIGDDFPNAKFVHLVRDARAIAMSEWFRNNPERGLSIWYDYNTAVLRLLDRLDDERTYTVRYEDIVEAPKTTVRDLVEFLGYEFEVEMLDYGRFEHADDKMNLWGTSGKGVKAHEARQHRALGTAIDAKTMKDRQNFSPKVLEAYANMEEVRQLNQQFGYTS
ncbi:sulfotransferase family protein [Baaleninema simplex]|uniref:sulfotransferase family protein n=1 Tax=Baaleninema simplex TaxID=2862350 RepID=UPI000348C201|nr:sulfotransferase [Baaleninema simplex]